MTTIHSVRNEIATLRQEARGLIDAAGTGDAAAVARFDAIEKRVGELQAQERRLALVDEADRRAAGPPVDGSDPQFDRLAEGVGILDAIRASLGGTDHTAGRALEVSAELERRSGRRAQGMFWPMQSEQRVLTTTAPGAGPGSNIIGPDYRPDAFIDRLRNAVKVKALGATLLTGLQGNVIIPRRKASVQAGWVAENTALPNSDPQFDQVQLSPKHAGVITEFSRQMIQQSSPDVEMLVRNDMALQLAEVLDTAATLGTGAPQPTGIVNTSGVNVLSLGTNGAAITYDNLADLMAMVANANVDGDSLALLTNTKVRAALGKLKDTTGRPLGLDVLFQGKPAAFSNVIPSNLTKGTGTGLSAAIYGNWSDLLIGVWSALDLLTNPYESTAYARGGVQVRAMLTVDIAVRHPESFAVIKDAIA